MRTWSAGSGWRLRGVVLAAYAINGFSLSAWMVRLPGIAETMGLDAADLGTFLLAGALGTLVTIPFAGALVQRWGSRAVYAIAALTLVLAYVGLGASVSAGDFGWLLGANVLHGAGFALTNVPQSVLGAASERTAGRTIVPQFHAMFSMSAAAGAATGGLLAATGTGPATQFLLLALLAAAARGAVLRGIADGSIGRATGLVTPAPGADEPVQDLPRRRPGVALRDSVWMQPQTVALGLVAFGAALSEGAANSWIAPALVETFAVPESRAALAVSVFLVAQTAGRLLGGAVVDRVGRINALRLSGAVSAVGVLVFAGAPSPVTAMVATAIWGVGAALSVPVAVSVAADAPNGAVRVAAVTSLASLANLAGPPAIGALGNVAGLQVGVGAVSVVLVAGLLVAGRAVGTSDRPPTHDELRQPGG